VEPRIAMARRSDVMLAVVLLFGASSPREPQAATRTHAVQQILLDGKAVAYAADVVVRQRGSATPMKGIRRGQAIEDGTRIDVPAHVSLVVVSTDAKSTATLEPGASVTFVSTGSGEVVRENSGTTRFSVIPRALDFFRVQSGEAVTAGVHGTEFSVSSLPGTVTIACTNGVVDVEKNGLLQVGPVVKKITLVDVVSPGLRPSVTYHPTQTWYLARFENFAQARAFYASELARARATGNKNAIAAALLNLGNVERISVAIPTRWRRTRRRWRSSASSAIATARRAPSLTSASSRRT
jgi:hypothetical protein